MKGRLAASAPFAEQYNGAPPSGARARSRSGSPEDFAAIIRNEVELWTRAAKLANYKPD